MILRWEQEELHSGQWDGGEKCKEEVMMEYEEGLETDELGTAMHSSKKRKP